jgi:hypothetical protein
MLHHKIVEIFTNSNSLSLDQKIKFLREIVTNCENIVDRNNGNWQLLEDFKNNVVRRDITTNLDDVNIYMSFMNEFVMEHINTCRLNVSMQHAEVIASEIDDLYLNMLAETETQEESSVDKLAEYIVDLELKIEELMTPLKIYDFQENLCDAFVGQLEFLEIKLDQSNQKDINNLINACKEAFRNKFYFSLPQEGQEEIDAGFGVKILKKNLDDYLKSLESKYLSDKNKYANYLQGLLKNYLELIEDSVKFDSNLEKKKRELEMGLYALGDPEIINGILRSIKSTKPDLLHKLQLKITTFAGASSLYSLVAEAEETHVFYAAIAQEKAEEFIKLLKDANSLALSQKEDADISEIIKNLSNDIPHAITLAFKGLTN